MPSGLAGWGIFDFPHCMHAQAPAGNTFGPMFQRAAENVGATYRADSFDASVIEVRACNACSAAVVGPPVSSRTAAPCCALTRAGDACRAWTAQRPCERPCMRDLGSLPSGHFSLCCIAAAGGSGRGPLHPGAVGAGDLVGVRSARAATGAGVTGRVRRAWGSCCGRRPHMRGMRVRSGSRMGGCLASLCAMRGAAGLLSVAGGCAQNQERLTFPAI